MSENKGKYTLKLFIYLAIAIFALWIISGFIILFFSEEGVEIGERGTFGDMFGAVNALFSGVALAGVIFTILQQKEELELQRKELSDTRKEFEQQNKTLRLQRFENTFFQILSFHHTLVQKVRGAVHIQGTGSEALNKFAEFISDNIQAKSGGFSVRQETIVETVQMGYNLSQREHSMISQVLANIISSLKIIDQTQLIFNQSEKQYYADIF